jgi:hypothetical protein
VPLPLSPVSPIQSYSEPLPSGFLRENKNDVVQLIGKGDERQVGVGVDLSQLPYTRNTCSHLLLELLSQLPGERSCEEPLSWVKGNIVQQGNHFEATTKHLKADLTDGDDVSGIQSK